MKKFPSDRNFVNPSFSARVSVYIRVYILVDISVNLCYRTQNENEEKTDADVNGLGAAN